MVKPYIDLNKDLRKKANNDFEKDSFKLIIMQLLEKLWEMLEYMDIKLVTTERRRNDLVSNPNYHTAKFFCRKCISNRNEKNRNTYEKTCPEKTRLSILESSKILMYEF